MSKLSFFILSVILGSTTAQADGIGSSLMGRDPCWESVLTGGAPIESIATIVEADDRAQKALYATNCGIQPAKYIPRHPTKHWGQTDEMRAVMMVVPAAVPITGAFGLMLTALAAMAALGWRMR